jgi:peptidyl-prolyl cis-trans isomerase SurA
MDGRRELTDRIGLDWENGLSASFPSRGGSLKPGRKAWVKILTTLCLFIGLAVCVRPALAQDELKIAAVVNDDVITQLDVFARLRAAMLSARMQDTPEVRQQLLPNVMRSLIDDHLKSQEARAQGVTVGDGEVNARIATLASRNNMSREDFETMLTGNGIMISALADQIRADISWSRLVQRKLRSTIRITDAEINESLARAKSARGQIEYRLSQIFQAIDSPKDAPAVQQSAQRLLEQLQSGADFGSLAQDFSQDTSAANGGDIGWVRADEADPAVGAELARLGGGADVKGRLIGPVQGTGGYYVVRIEDVRQASDSAVAPGSVHLVRLLWSLTPTASENEVQSAQDQADTFSKKEAHSCQEFQALAEDAASAVFTDLGRVPVDDMPAEIRNMVMTQQVGEPTKGIRGDGGVAIFVVCDRGDSSGQISRVAIADRLAAERLETLARGYLSDLRRAAYIDIRL